MADIQRVRVFMGCSLDGFIAGPDNDIAWLEEDRRQPGDLAPDAEALTLTTFMGEVGAMLMGRTTYDAVIAMGYWGYGDTPVLVATTHPIETPGATVTAVAGPIESLVAHALAAAGGQDVYLDGGDLVRQALNAGLVDEVTVTFVPVLLGQGVRLFDGLLGRHNLQFTRRATYEGGLVQVTARCLRG